MIQPGRKYSAGSSYRYGFNGKENDKEISEGVQDYGMRISDSRLGRFLSVDPISSMYPYLTPYQFASNRPIDGIDLDGKEYITFHVIVSKGSDGKPVFKKYIAIDFRGLSSQQMAEIHKNKDYIANFYKYYSESFGAEGRGFKWIYFDDKGNKLGENWQQKQTSLYKNTKFSGYYSGPGCITKFGPGLEDGTYKELGEDYDFSYEPMSYSDAISKSHDEMQQKTIKLPQGWLEDVRTLESDIILLDEAQSASLPSLVSDNYSREDYLRIQQICLFFSATIRYKEWKIKEMEKKGIDKNSAEDQLKIIFEDWKPSWFSKDIGVKKLLSASGGGASEPQRNTVKGKPPKKYSGTVGNGPGNGGGGTF